MAIQNNTTAPVTAPVTTSALSQDELNRRGEALIQMLSNVKLLQQQLDTKKQELMPYLQKGPIVLPDGTITMMKPAQRLNLNRKMLKQVLMQHLRISEPTAETLLNTGSVKKIINAYVKITQKHLNKARANVPKKMSDINDLVKNIQTKITALKKFADNDTFNVPNILQDAADEFKRKRLSEIQKLLPRKDSPEAVAIDTINRAEKILTIPPPLPGKYGTYYGREFPFEKNSSDADIHIPSYILDEYNKNKNAAEKTIQDLKDKKIYNKAKNLIQLQEESERLMPLQGQTLIDYAIDKNAIRADKTTPWQNAEALMKRYENKYTMSAMGPKSGKIYQENRDTARDILENVKDVGGDAAKLQSLHSKMVNAVNGMADALQSSQQEKMEQREEQRQEAIKAQEERLEKPLTLFEEGPYSPVYEKDAQGSNTDKIDETATAQKRLNVMAGILAKGGAGTSKLVIDAHNPNDEIISQLAVLNKEGALTTAQGSRIREAIASAENHYKANMPVNPMTLSNMVEKEIAANKAVNGYINARDNTQEETSIDKNSVYKDSVTNALTRRPQGDWDKLITKYDKFIGNTSIQDKDKDALFDALHKESYIQDGIEDLNKQKDATNNPKTKQYLDREIKGLQDLLPTVYSKVPSIAAYNEADKAVQDIQSRINNSHNAAEVSQLQEKVLPDLQAKLGEALKGLQGLSSVMSPEIMPASFKQQNTEAQAKEEAYNMRMDALKEAKNKVSAAQDNDIIQAVAAGVQSKNIPEEDKKDLSDKILAAKSPAEASSIMSQALKQYKQEPESTPQVTQTTGATQVTQAQEGEQKQPVEAIPNNIPKIASTVGYTPEEVRALTPKISQDNISRVLQKQYTPEQMEAMRKANAASGEPVIQQAPQATSSPSSGTIQKIYDSIKGKYTPEEIRDMMYPNPRQDQASALIPQQPIIEQVAQEDDEDKNPTTLAANDSQDKLTQLIQNAAALGYTPEQIESMRKVLIPITGEPVIQSKPKEVDNITSDIEKVYKAMDGKYTPDEIRQMMYPNPREQISSNNVPSITSTPEVMQPIQSPHKTETEEDNSRPLPSSTVIVASNDAKHNSRMKETGYTVPSVWEDDKDDETGDVPIVPMHKKGNVTATIPTQRGELSSEKNEETAAISSHIIMMDACIKDAQDAIKSFDDATPEDYKIAHINKLGSFINSRENLIIKRNNINKSVF